MLFKVAVLTLCVITLNISLNLKFKTGIALFSSSTASTFTLRHGPQKLDDFSFWFFSFLCNYLENGWIC